MAKESGLGKGLGALFGAAAAEPDDFLEGGSLSSPSEIPIDLIDNDVSQPRKQFDGEKLEELAQSIRTHGVMQPLVVTATENGRYRIIAGERRFRASKIAGLTVIPVVVREGTADKDALEMALIENIQREDLNPMEQAGALRRLVKEYRAAPGRCGCPSGEIAQCRCEPDAPAAFAREYTGTGGVGTAQRRSRPGAASFGDGGCHFIRGGLDTAR